MSTNPIIAVAAKPLQTKRPFTPKDKERLLFGKRTKNRPPNSSFSLNSLQHVAESSGSSSTTPSYARKEDELISDLGVKENFGKTRLPYLETIKPPLLTKRKSTEQTRSLDNLPEENDYFSGPLSSRNAKSSPRELRNEEFNFSPFAQLSGTFSKTALASKEQFSAKQKRSTKSSRSKEAKDIDPTTQNSFDNLKAPKNIESLWAFIEKLNQKSLKLGHTDILVEQLISIREVLDEEYRDHEKLRPKLKTSILKFLYNCMESESEEVLLYVAWILLAINVTGQHLTTACKLIFQVSKNEKNDTQFLNKNLLQLLVDAVGRSSPFDDAEACVYAYGALRFLTLNPLLLEKILPLGLLPLMVLHMKLINIAKMEKIQFPERTSDALFQLTGTIRNVASENVAFESLVKYNAIGELCKTIKIFIVDQDIVINISRIFSIISTNDSCCYALGNCEDIFKILIEIFEKYSANEEIIVRLSYTAGNIMAASDNSRVKFYHENKSMVTLLDLWRIYLDRTLQSFSLSETNISANESTMDVMVKIIRIIANIAINSDIGKEMNESYGFLLITELLKILISNPFKKNYELVLSVLSTLNNLSFYYTAALGEDNFHLKQIDILEAISEYLTSNDNECTIEATRILSNLSRSRVTRDYLSESDSKIFNLLIGTLSSDDAYLIKTTIGVFINLMSDTKHRTLFKNIGGVNKMIVILNKYGFESDWILAMLVCQVLWNYCVDSVNLYEAFSEKEIQVLIGILIDRLDEGKIFGTQSSTQIADVFITDDYMLWEEFANVGTSLLEKFENFLDRIEVEENQQKNEGQIIKLTQPKLN